MWCGDGVLKKPKNDPDISMPDPSQPRNPLKGTVLFEGELISPLKEKWDALPGRKLVPSKTLRMLEPYEVDLLRQDLQAVLELLGASDR